MVSPTRDRDRLAHRERLLYGSLAVINAACEEIVFRWFRQSEFSVYLRDDDDDRHHHHRPGDVFGRNIAFGRFLRLDANVAQAALFGTLHYHGIPSGFAGVSLTFVYGWIMGVLSEDVGDGGLFLPVVAHAISDYYYLFSSVARGKALHGVNAGPQRTSSSSS